MMQLLYFYDDYLVDGERLNSQTVQLLEGLYFAVYKDKLAIGISLVNYAWSLPFPSLTA
jgi:hypothetical protein